jgi:hypothetical protein
VKSNHHAVVQLGAPAPHAKRKAANGATVDASDPTHGADAEAVTQRSDDFNLLVAGKVVHGLDPWLWIGPKRGSGKTARNPLYSPEWSLLRGSIPGF